jgi:hypothetical protein
LDWTRSPLVAAYFAACSAKAWSGGGGSAPPGNQPDRALCVWAFDYSRHALCQSGQAFQPVYLDPELKPSIQLVTAPHAGNANLHAQDGVFTVYRPATVDPGAPVDRRSLVEQLAASLTDPRGAADLFYEFTLPAHAAATLMWRLAREGMSAARAFPDYTGVVRTLAEE